MVVRGELAGWAVAENNGTMLVLPLATCEGGRPGKPIDHDELTFELIQIREMMSSFGNEAPVQSLGYRKKAGRCGAKPDWPRVVCRV